MPDILALVGMRLEPGKATPEEEQQVRDMLTRHEPFLAEREHEGWMAHLLAEAWTFAETRDEDRRRHDSLRPFHELRPADKEKDRAAIRHYVDFARQAGFKIVMS
jgi:hypothetical protein